ncbi:MAG: hypothetical protein AABM33_04965 [Pseudomonadota bacterium]
MVRILSFLATLFAVLGLAAVDGSALAQPKDKDKDRKEQSGPQGKKDGKQQKVKQHKHKNGKDLVADKIKKNGRHQFDVHGKHTAHVDVKDGKITGVSVKHAEKGNVPVKKYKTKKKMAEAPAGGMQAVSLILVQTQYLGMTWIGYAYIDDWGDEIIYWFPYDMIYDADTGAIEYIPV